MITAAETYATLVNAVNAQRVRLHGEEAPGARWDREAAQRFRHDPHRSLDANLNIIASYVEPQDVLIDVGGGAGRLCLPMALRCREGIVVDASQAMGEAFLECAAVAGITNVRFIRAEWLAAEEIHGDIAVAANVTYFVRDIVSFVRKMETAARRRVLITVRSMPGPNLRATLFRLVYGEEQQPSPGYRELLPVLWEMGILPDVRVLPSAQRGAGCPADAALPQTRNQAVAMALQGQWLRPVDRERARRVIEAQYDELFSATPEGFRPLWLPETRELLITWGTDHQP
jgi:2-polyprenyl-3-methyl-5-hydroxy-6-metoxy-1,4-benzoquinol methylase